MTGAHATSVRLDRDTWMAGMPGLIHGFTERSGGVSAGRFASLNLGPLSGDSRSNVSENRARLLAAAGAAGFPVAAPRQVHSATVTVIDAEEMAGDRVVPGDAVVTAARGVVLLILAADCVPVLLFDPARQVIAAVHAGWRGTAGGIVGNAVTAMQARFGCRPEHVHAALGPAIGRCCYEVGPEVLDAVTSATNAPPGALFDPLVGGKGRLDLVAANTAQLRACGLNPNAISALGLCTACNTDRFFSHRREGEPTGRGAALIALTPPHTSTLPGTQ